MKFTRSFATVLSVLAGGQAAHAQSPAIWKGVYLGAHAGGGWGKVTGPDIDMKVDPSGFLGGIHGGYNWQSGSVVFGVEGDVSGGSLSWNFSPGAGESVKLSTSYLASLRGRVGVSTGPALLYATGGVAFTNIKISGTEPGGTYSFSDSGSGWVVGAGMEYMVSSNIALRVEGLHNRFNLSINDEKARYTINELRAGLSYKF